MKIATFTVSLSILVLSLACRQAEQPPQQLESAHIKSAAPRWLVKEGFIRFGDTLEKVLRRELADHKLHLDIISRFASAYDVRHLRPNRRYCVYTDSLGGFQGFEYFAGLEETVKVFRDSVGQLSARNEQLPLITRVKTLRGAIANSLYEAVLACGETPELIGAFSDVFQWDIDFFVDTRKGDEFRIMYEAVHVFDSSQPDSLGEFVRYGRILAGEYVQSDASYGAIYFSPTEKTGGYYDLNGKSFQKVFLKSPLTYSRISSRFSGARRHPILKIVRAHYAVDFAAPAGTPVSSVADGVVIDKGYNSGVGNFVKVRHKNPRYVTLYGHLRAFADDIKTGKNLQQRDLVGYVGSTGLATGPHLHYAFYDNGRPINPMKIKNSSGDPIPEAKMPAFMALKDFMLGRLAAAPMHQGQGMQDRLLAQELSPPPRPNVSEPDPGAD